MYTSVMQAAERGGDSLAAQAVLGLCNQQHSQQVAQAAAQAKAQALHQRKALGALHQHGAQHAAVQGCSGHDAQQLARNGQPAAQAEHQLFGGADHGNGGHIRQRAQLGAVFQRHDPAAGIPGQRGHQHLRDAQLQAEQPAAGAVIPHQLHQTGHAQCAGKDGILGKHGQHRIAKEHHPGIHNISHYSPSASFCACTSTRLRASRTR